MHSFQGLLWYIFGLLIAYFGSYYLIKLILPVLGLAINLVASFFILVWGWH